MQQGRADAVVSDDTLLVGLAAQDPNLELVGEALTEEPYGIGVNQDNVDLVQFVNGVLEADARGRPLDRAVPGVGRRRECSAASLRRMRSTAESSEHASAPAGRYIPQP